ncbi:hypothetical protein PENSUB_6597 [Penicillium subrubescens]|uniref:Uncharacterized protein n=1 Tax=Penicillium subrubescens TaxID=1316194 RepID=A0A1Q5U081_9EURO|nr:hypothetical protein PENSUB_6597 [Penicillium subrubescens]
MNTIINHKLYKPEASSEPSTPSLKNWTPPDSPIMGSAAPRATVEDLKHLFDVLEKALSDLTMSDAGGERATSPGPETATLQIPFSKCQALTALAGEGLPQSNQIAV